MCEEEDEPLDVDLPLRTMEQLDETEQNLEDTEAQKKMVKNEYCQSTLQSTIYSSACNNSLCYFVNLNQDRKVYILWRELCSPK